MSRAAVEKAIQRLEIQIVHMTRIIAYLQDTIDEMRKGLEEAE